MTLPPLRDVIAEYGLRAKKSFGQNFLLDMNLTRRIVREAYIGEADLIYEVGPGPGGLTRALLEITDLPVVAVEKDQRCLEALGSLQNAYPGRLTVIEADALSVDEPAILPAHSRAAIIANLPYNISTELAGKWLTSEPWPPWFTGLTLMFQREVAERLTAKPGSRTYGRLSVLAQWRAQPRRLFDIPPNAFVPAPKVTSTVVSFRVLETPVAPAEAWALQRVTAVAFNQRRKMLRQSLKGLGVSPAVLLAEARIDPTLRAEVIDIEGFCALARAFTRLQSAT